MERLTKRNFFSFLLRICIFCLGSITLTNFWNLVNLFFSLKEFQNVNSFECSISNLYHYLFFIINNIGKNNFTIHHWTCIFGLESDFVNCLPIIMRF